MGVVSLQQAVHSIHHSLNSWNIALNNNPLIYGDYKMSNISLVDQISSKDRALIHNSFFPRFLSHYKLERKMWADKAIYILENPSKVEFVPSSEEEYIASCSFLCKADRELGFPYSSHFEVDSLKPLSAA